MNRTAPIFLIILAVAVFYVYIDPAYEDIRQLRTKEQSYVDSIESVRAVEQERNDLVSKYNSFSNTDIVRLEEMVPDTVDNIRLVAEINSIAQQYDIGIRNVKIAEDGGNSRSSTRPSIGIAQGDTHRTLLMSFTFDAPYKVFTDFIKDLEQNLRIIDFSSISFGTENGTKGTTYNVTLKTYWLP